MHALKTKQLFTHKSDDKILFILQSRSIKRIINKIKRKKKLKSIIRKRKIFNATTIDSQLQKILFTLSDHPFSRNIKPVYEILEKNINKILDLHSDNRKNERAYQVLINNISAHIISYNEVRTEKAYHDLVNNISNLLENYTHKKNDKIYTALKNSLSTIIPFHLNTQKMDELFKDLILIEGSKKTRNVLAYRFFYNKLIGKIQTYQLIDTDRGANFEFSSNLGTKIIGSSLNIAYVIPIPLIPAVTAGAGQLASKKVSDKRKINKTKNKLDHCITSANFIQLVSILLTKIHEPDFNHQENIDLFLASVFQNFWSLFKKLTIEKPNRENLDEFWSECLVEYFSKLKCPLQQENFCDVLATIDEKNRPKESSKTIFTESDQYKTFYNPATVTLVNNLATSFQQQLLIMHFMHSLLTQLYMQGLMQQKPPNAFYVPPHSLDYRSLGFFAATTTLAETPNPSDEFNPIQVLGH